MDFFQDLSKLFWSEKFWLLSNMTWSDVEPGSRGVEHTDYRHLLWAIPITLAMLIIRYVVEKHVFNPLGKYIGVKSTRSKAPLPNKLFEKAYLKSTKLDNDLMKSLRKQSDLTERKIERWWRSRKAQDRPTTLDKFCEGGWKAFYFAFSLSFGLYHLWDKPWAWEFKQHWTDYPHQSIDSGLGWYYVNSMGFTLSMLISLNKDVKRKDFWQLVVHHILTILLLSLSWITNIHRAGSVVIFLHDCADVPLEILKIMKYANYQKVCDIFFCIFTLTWLITRLVMFPFIIYSFLVDMPVFSMFPAYYCIVLMCFGILVLNIQWTEDIVEVLIQTIRQGKMERDVRSDSDE